MAVTDDSTGRLTAGVQGNGDGGYDNVLASVVARI